MHLKYLKSESTCSVFNFCGISIQQSSVGLSWSIENSSLEKWQAAAKFPVRPTPRTYFSFLGFVRFALPLFRLPKRTLGRYTKLQSVLGKIDPNWDREDSRIIVLLGNLVDLILSFKRVWSYAGSFNSFTKNDFDLIACDATPFRWAAWTLTREDVVQEKLEGSFAKEIRFESAETYALHKGIEAALRRKSKAIAVSTDNTVAGRSLERGYSRSEEVDNIVRSIQIYMYTNIYKYMSQIYDIYKYMSNLGGL